MLETIITLNAAADGWRPTYEQDFIHRLGWIVIGVFASIALAHLLTGDARTIVVVYGGYFVARAVEHAFVRTQFWLSTTGFGIAALTLVVVAMQSGEVVAAGAMVLAAGAALTLGVGRTIHPTAALVVFAPPLALWSLNEGPLTDGIASALAALGPLLLLRFRHSGRRALAERIRGRVRLDSGEVYSSHRRGVLRLADRRESEPRARFTVWAGPLSKTLAGRVLIRCRDCARCRALQGDHASELHRILADVPMVVAFDRSSALIEALAGGALDSELEALCALEHPLVVIDGGAVHIETMSEGDEAAETLVRFGRAIEAHAFASTRGAYR